MKSQYFKVFNTPRECDAGKCRGRATKYNVQMTMRYCWDYVAHWHLDFDVSPEDLGHSELLSNLKTLYLLTCVSLPSFQIYEASTLNVILTRK